MTTEADEAISASGKDISIVAPVVPARFLFPFILMTTLIGSLTGMLVASLFILPSLQVAEFRDAELQSHQEYSTLLPSEVDGLITTAMEKHAKAEPEARLAMVAHDLDVVKTPYVAIAIVVLLVLAVGGFLLTAGAIFIQRITGLYSLIGVSACMSLMFPTIYGIALNGLTPNDAKLGSAGRIFAIVGGAFMPRYQGALIDGDGMTIAGQALESVRVSFFLPMVCFVVIAVFGFAVYLIPRKSKTAQL